MIKLLLVEDNVDTMKKYIEYIGNRRNIEIVGVAYNGIEAIDILGNKDISMVVLDIIMPKLDGIGVLKYIRSMSNKPNVIITSIINSNYTISQLMKFNVLYYVLKPFNLEILIERIEDICSNITYSTLVEEKINNYLHSIGIPSKLKGYFYLKNAIEKLVRYGIDNTNISLVYSELSKKYNVTPKAIEKGIRDVVGFAFERGNIENVHNIFNTQISNISGKVTNKTFVYTISENIVFDLNSK